MFLIMSGAYVGQELESEFGKIPPSFLPLGNKRLFQHQIKLAPNDVDVYLSIPDSFSVSRVDIKWLSQNKVNLLRTPEGLTLGESVVAALNMSGQELNEPLHILYGDTLFKELTLADDSVSISNAKNSYKWAFLTNNKAHWLQDNDSVEAVTPKKIINGYFNFSQPRELIKNITQCKWDYIDGLNLYHKNIGLNPVESKGWLDFGHVNTYYRSKADFTTQRAFNELKVTSKWIEKSSSNDCKIAAEAHWFENLPMQLRGNIPQYLGANISGDKTSYRLEYLHLTALNELFVFSRLPPHIWTQIFESCLEFLTTCEQFKDTKKTSSNSIERLFKKKTRDRLEDYCVAKGIKLHDKWYYNGGSGLSINDLLATSEQHLPVDKKSHSILHGDFCFSNILYDFRAGKVKTIDPRGLTPDGELTIYGDIRYDLAKLSHSVLGLYDWIIAGYFNLKIENNQMSFCVAEDLQYEQIQKSFIELIEKKFGVTARNLYAMQIQLFLSMLPLHSDDSERQQGLFANAFRLHEILIRLD